MIYLTGDTHGDMELNRLSSKTFPEGKALTKNDYVIVLGDFGVLWENEPDEQEQWLLNWLGKTKPWTTLFIDGNHENFDRLSKLETVQMFGADVGKVNDSVYHLRRGRMYTIDSKKVFTFGGATSIDKGLRVQNISWWPEELPSVQETEYALDTLDKHNWDVDYIFTHTAPAMLIKNEIDRLLSLSKKEPDCLTKFLDLVWGKCRYRKWFFGHFHIDKAFNDGRMQALYRNIVKL